MKKGLNKGIVFIVIIAGVYFGLNINKTTTIEVIQQNDEAVTIQPTQAQMKEADEIKKAADEFMYFNFAKFGKTSWYDSVTSSGAKITDRERIFAVQYTDDSQFENAKKFVGSLNMFFSDKTNKKHNVEKIILFDKDNNQVYEMDTVKW
ncbi:hypothetical protein ACFQ4X_05510 [Fictibacillus halophilus]|uniref:hypothetical protein n=1 Tax=Fictibacillus halophilus TaxID=1610490 RepID=UPI003626CFEF